MLYLFYLNLIQQDYNYQNFLNVYCETAIEDYSNHLGFNEWYETEAKPKDRALLFEFK